MAVQTVGYARREQIGFWQGGVCVPRRGGEVMRKLQEMKMEQELDIYFRVHRKGREICGVLSTEAKRMARMLGAEALERIVSPQQRCCSPQGPVRAKSPFQTLLL